MTNDTPKAPRLDSTLSKGLRILDMLTATQGGKSVTEISKELELTKSNAFRLLQTLSTLGFVRQRENKQYVATLKTWQIGRRVVENLNLREAAATQMRMLSQETSDTVYLAVAEGLSVVYIDKVESQQPIRSWNPIGGAAPIHCVSTGKAIIAADYTFWRERLRGNLTRYTDRTITNLAALDADVARIQACGYATDTGEFRERVLGFGAAIRLPNGAPIGAIGISMPDVNLPANGEASYGEMVRRAAEEIMAQVAET
ncbi:IclR family transcriptional regulator [Ferrovibrio xuzhouensis]|uniref:IclR family transcriptional regulator n=1 Tax=Ferrovibrio xuzhouensis TaxID=1576914 RepID=A0ABV7VMF6_9PROT